MGVSVCFIMGSALVWAVPPVGLAQRGIIGNMPRLLRESSHASTGENNHGNKNLGVPNRGKNTELIVTKCLSGSSAEIKGSIPHFAVWTIVCGSSGVHTKLLQKRRFRRLTETAARIQLIKGQAQLLGHISCHIPSPVRFCVTSRRPTDGRMR